MSGLKLERLLNYSNCGTVYKFINFLIHGTSSISQLIPQISNPSL